ncbi:MAG: tyrosine--tRNA ligase [Sulfolobales archaeon]|nr:tyrosine--tRNA ligase [Sulfolobales archaeon]MCX8185868.1 tyrosine--tRNA ligase [Sulfolobales archaeon]MDW7969125.1 tyrosine--tRNA ligase [Sulfolobales archaeon]
MNLDEKVKLISRNAVELITLEELRNKLISGEKLKGYLGFEPSGLFHIGWLIWALKYRDLVNSGIEMYLLQATWHAWINDKLGGDLNLIRAAANHVISVLKNVGIDVSRIKVVDAEELISDKDYWSILIKVAKSISLARVKRALTIMGRKSEEGETDFSKLIYPLMQVTDIFYLDLDVALGGLDQRKAHMLARDVAEKLGFKKPIAIHTPLLTSLQGASRMDAKEELDETLSDAKMSKSRPESAIFITDPDEAIRNKVMNAFCPPKQTEFNPILEIAKYIMFYEEPKEFIIERPSKYGGPLEVTTYRELEAIYVSGSLHPLDLKSTVAKYLIDFIRPIRENVLKDSEDLISKISSYISR